MKGKLLNLNQMDNFLWLNFVFEYWNLDHWYLELLLRRNTHNFKLKNYLNGFEWRDLFLNTVKSGKRLKWKAVESFFHDSFFKF